MRSPSSCARARDAKKKRSGDAAGDGQRAGVAVDALGEVLHRVVVAEDVDLEVFDERDVDRAERERVGPALVVDEVLDVGDRIGRLDGEHVHLLHADEERVALGRVDLARDLDAASTPRRAPRTPDVETVVMSTTLSASIVAFLCASCS